MTDGQKELPLFGEPKSDAGAVAPDAAVAGSGFPAAVDGPLKRLMDDNFLQYASYVIRDRAIPHLDDGLKPVQRRILFSLYANDDGKFIKVANVVGFCMQFHPHGDASIYDTIVKMAQPFSYRHILVQGQGNFGSVDGDAAAASTRVRYRPVWDASLCATASGVPWATRAPPRSPPSGPRSMTQSLARMTSRLCSMTMAE